MVVELGGRNARAYLPRHITLALRHTNCLPANKSQEQQQQQRRRPTSRESCTVAFLLLLLHFFFLTQDLALIHSHSSDVLTPKGPCPAVTEQLTPHHTLPTPQFLLSPCLLSGIKKKKKEKDSVGGAAVKLSSHHRTTFSAETSLKKSSHFFGGFNFIILFFLFTHISTFPFFFFFFRSIAQASLYSCSDIVRSPPRPPLSPAHPAPPQLKLWLGQHKGVL